MSPGAQLRVGSAQWKPVPGGPDRGAMSSIGFHHRRAQRRLMNCEGARNAAHRLALVGMARDLALAELNALCAAIGTELRKLYSDMLQEELPGRMAGLIEQLDQR
jgi:hypothetical protein